MSIPISAPIGIGIGQELNSMHLQMAAIAGGGGGAPAYDPGMMTFNGTDAYYSDVTVPNTANQFTSVVRFNIPSFTGGGNVRIHNVTSSTSAIGIGFFAYSSDFATTELRDKVAAIIQIGGVGSIFQILSNVVVCDGADHVIFFSCDASTGDAIFYVDGVDADDLGYTSRIATTGTLTTTNSGFGVGANYVGTGLVAGKIGYVGLSSTYLTNPTDFYHPTNGLQELDETTWTEWGAQPLYWNRSGTMTANAGSAGPMTENGTITTTVGDAYDFPMMTFAGGYYSKSAVALSGNAHTCIARINRSAFTGGGEEIFFHISDTGVNRIYMRVHASDHATVEDRGKIILFTQNGAGTSICRLRSNVNVCDGLDHMVFFKYDAAAGTAVFEVDGVDAIDDGWVFHLITTGTIDAGSYAFSIGADASGTSNFGGKIGYAAYIESYSLDPNDFIAGNTPLEVDTSGWTEFGAQPKVFASDAKLDTGNLGSLGAFTKTGTITGPA